MIKIGLLQLSLVVLCTRPTREHYKTAGQHACHASFAILPFGTSHKKGKKKLLTRFEIPDAVLMENSKEKKSDNGSEKEERTTSTVDKVHSCSMNLFIEGYGSSTIKSLLVIKKIQGL